VHGHAGTRLACLLAFLRHLFLANRVEVPVLFFAGERSPGFQGYHRLEYFLYRASMSDPKESSDMAPSDTSLAEWAEELLSSYEALGKKIDKACPGLESPDDAQRLVYWIRFDACLVVAFAAARITTQASTCTHGP
jgi:hypothetical protein